MRLLLSVFGLEGVQGNDQVLEFIGEQGKLLRRQMVQGFAFTGNAEEEPLVQLRLDPFIRNVAEEQVQRFWSAEQLFAVKGFGRGSHTVL